MNGVEAAEPMGVRAKARQARHAAIMASANQQLADAGAAALSLRAIAREVGIVSSAIHRYFPTRDDLLTSLIVEAYDSLGEAAEAVVAGSRRRAPADRWVETATTIRSWAIEQPHRWALLYGTPVPGYAAPDRTIAPAARVSVALLSIVDDAGRDGTLRATSPDDGGLDRGLVELAGQVDLDIDGQTMVKTVAAWTQLFGLVSFELFGQTKNMFDDNEAVFAATASTMADLIGLTDRGPARFARG